MHTEGLQDKEDELQRFIIRLQPLVLTDETESQTVLLAIKSNLEGSIKAAAR